MSEDVRFFFFFIAIDTAVLITISITLILKGYRLWSRASLQDIFLVSTKNYVIKK